MSDELYRYDRGDIVQKQEQYAGQQLAEIESRAAGNAFTFLKNNAQNKKIRERLSEPHFDLVMGAMLAKIAGLGAIKKEVTDFDKQDIAKVLTRKFADLTPEAIMRAFELERYGEYPERTPHFDLFNAEYVSKVLDKYKVWVQQTKTQYNLSLKPAPAALPEKTEAEQEEILRQGTISRFQEYKEKKDFAQPSVHIYKFLFDKGLLPKETPYENLYKIAERLLLTELKEKKAMTRIENLSIKEAIEEITTPKNDKDGNPILSPKVLALAKRLVLEYAFKYWTDKKIDVEKHLNK